MYWTVTCNNSCTVQDVLLTCENFYFLRTQKWGCTQEATHFTNMVTGHNRFSVVEELSSPAFCKTAAPVSPRRGYPELPDLTDNPLPSSLYIYPNFQKPVVPTTYIFLPQVYTRVFHKCAVHLGSQVLVPHAATTRLSVSNCSKNWWKKNVGSWDSAVIAKMFYVHGRPNGTSTTKLSLSKSAFLLCLKMYPIQYKFTIT